MKAYASSHQGQPLRWLMGALMATSLLWLARPNLASAMPPGAPDNAVPAAASGQSPAADTEEINFIHHFLDSIGWKFGAVFILLSICLVALVVLLALDLRMSIAVPPGFVEQFTDTVNKRKFKEAFEMARADKSFLGKVMTDGMARLQYGIEDARDAAFNRVASLRSGKEQLTNYIAVISSIGPYIGLVGTVYGMIWAFMGLAKPGANVDIKNLSGAISHALVVTMVGIGLAVPGLFFTVFFRNRTTKISMDVENLADDLLTQMYHNSKKPAPTGTGAVTTPAAGGENRAAAPAKPGG